VCDQWVWDVLLWVLSFLKWQFPLANWPLCLFFIVEHQAWLCLINFTFLWKCKNNFFILWWPKLICSTSIEQWSPYLPHCFHYETHWSNMGGWRTFFMFYVLSPLLNCKPQRLSLKFFTFTNFLFHLFTIQHLHLVGCLLFCSFKLVPII